MSSNQKRCICSHPTIKPLAKKVISICFACLFLLFYAETHAQPEAKARQLKPLLNLIQELEEQTNYRFLYSEALIASLKTDLEANESDILNKLDQQFKNDSIRFLVDEKNKQVVIFEFKYQKAKEIRLSGQIIDNESGESLPFATISWNLDGKLKGVVANESGYFSTSIFLKQGEELPLKASFLGYESQTVSINSQSLQSEQLFIRLRPRTRVNREVIIHGSYLYGMSDQAQKSVSLSSGQILGESNTISSLQTIPSVHIATAMNSGMHLRGSPADGFMVMLDGMTVYNQSHLFGLFDNFNKAAISTSGLYYDVAPAHIPAPVGGTLSLQTRKGSLNKHEFQAGMSNTSFNTTLDGPIKKGISSYLFSIKASTMNQLDWLGNGDLISWGLDASRDKKVVELQEGVTSLNPSITQNPISSANFMDLHGSLHRQWKNGALLDAAIYYGFDETQTDYDRAFREFSLNQEQSIQFRPATTQQNWENFKGSSSFKIPISKSLYSRTSLGFSMFESNFSKDDFTYTQIDAQSGNLQTFSSELGMQSIINDVQFKQDFEWLFHNQRITLGTSHQYFSTEYFEDSFERPGLFIEENAIKSDAYISGDFQFDSRLFIESGFRFSYFSNGNYALLMPRLKFRYSLFDFLQIGGGYGKNYQLLNRVRFSNILSSDVWILANQNEPPTSAESYSAGLYFPLHSNHYIQIEGFYRLYDHLRLHEIDTYSAVNVFDVNSWFTENDGDGQGLEVFISNRFGPVEITNSYTLSRTTFQNDEINNGIPYAVDWDRTHQYAGQLNISLPLEFKLFVSQIIATGTPNKLALFGRQTEERLDHYLRTDIRLSTERVLWNDTRLNASVAVYNLLDRRNPWYRELGFAINQNAAIAEFRRIPIEIYDLGIQPSFSLQLKF